MKATVQNHRGTPTLFLNDRPVFANCHLIGYMDPAATANIQESVRAFARNRIHIYSIDAVGSEWTTPRPEPTSPFNFSETAARLLPVLEADADALFLLRTGFETYYMPDNWWQKAYPDEMELLTDGPCGSASYASLIWQSQVKELLALHLPQPLPPGRPAPHRPPADRAAGQQGGALALRRRLHQRRSPERTAAHRPHEQPDRLPLWQGQQLLRPLHAPDPLRPPHHPGALPGALLGLRPGHRAQLPLEDPETTVLGESVYSLGRCRPGFGVKRFDSGGGSWSSVYVATPNVPAPVLRGIARYAGMHLYSEEGDVLYATPDLLAVHTVASGPRTFTLPRRVETVYDLYHDRVLAHDAAQFAVTLPPASTAFYYTGAAARIDALVGVA